MALVQRTIEDVESLLSDIKEIADNVQHCQREMMVNHLEFVELDARTAAGHIAWLKNWSIKVAAAPARRKGALRAIEDRARMNKTVQRAQKKL
jgi:hypothetical protein